MEDARILKWSSVATEDILGSVSTRTGLTLYRDREPIVKNASVSLRLSCLDFSPAQANLLACGSELGQLVLFEDGIKRSTLNAQSHRSLRFVCWDPSGAGRLAVGFQGVRGEPGLSILDAVQAGESPRSYTEKHNMSMSEGTVDGNFLKPNVLAVGLQSRYLRVHDLRASEHLVTMQTVAHPWGPIQGVRTHLGEYIATFGASSIIPSSSSLGAGAGGSSGGGLNQTSTNSGIDGGSNFGGSVPSTSIVSPSGGSVTPTTSAGPPDLESSSSSCVKIWDIRRIDRPLCFISAIKGHFPGNVAQVEWDPYRRQVLHFITGSEALIRSVSLARAFAEGEYHHDSPTATKGRSRGSFEDEDRFFHLESRGCPQVVQAIALKPFPPSTPIALSASGGISFIELRRPKLRRCTKFEHVVGVDNSQSLFRLQSIKKDDPSVRLKESSLPDSLSSEVDKMCELANLGYGADPALNISLTRGSTRRMWEWIHRGGIRSFVDPIAPSQPSRKQVLVFPGYFSPNRIQTLKLCGWAGEAASSRLATTPEDWQSIAALYILDSKDVKKAVSFLTSNSRSEHRKDTLCLAVATALAGWPGMTTTAAAASESDAVASTSVGATTAASSSQPPQAPPLLVPSGSVVVSSNALHPASATTASSSNNNNNSRHSPMSSSQPGGLVVLGDSQQPQQPVRSPSRLALDDEEEERMSRAQVWCDSVSELQKRLNPLLRATFLYLIVCTLPGTARKAEEISSTVNKLLLPPVTSLRLHITSRTEDGEGDDDQQQQPDIENENDESNAHGGLSLTDRLAFACAYASDEVLKAFIERETRAGEESGNLESLLLTGLGPGSRGWKILRRAADAKTDFQTVGLVNGMALAMLPQSPDSAAAAAAPPPNTTTNTSDVLATNSNVTHHLSISRLWLERYRDFLDEMDLYQLRARLDVGLSRLRGSALVVQSLNETVHVHCAKCGANMLLQKRLSEGTNKSQQKKPLGSTMTPGANTSTASNSSRLCYNCSRTLPVCSVCRSPMEGPNPLVVSLGVTSLSSLPPTMADSDDSDKDKQRPAKNALGEDFRQWLTWCLDCKHGGHVGCINDWFKMRKVCPVASCQCCKCARDGCC